MATLSNRTSNKVHLKTCLSLHWKLSSWPFQKGWLAFAFKPIFKWEVLEPFLDPQFTKQLLFHKRK